MRTHSRNSDAHGGRTVRTWWGPGCQSPAEPTPPHAAGWGAGSWRPRRAGPGCTLVLPLHRSWRGQLNRPPGRNLGGRVMGEWGRTHTQIHVRTVLNWECSISMPYKHRVFARKVKAVCWNNESTQKCYMDMLYLSCFTWLQILLNVSHAWNEVKWYLQSMQRAQATQTSWSPTGPMATAHSTKSMSQPADTTVPPVNLAERYTCHPLPPPQNVTPVTSAPSTKRYTCHPLPPPQNVTPVTPAPSAKHYTCHPCPLHKTLHLSTPAPSSKRYTCQPLHKMFGTCHTCFKW